MSHSDPIADLLTRLRNAKSAKHRYVDVLYSKMNRSIVEVIKNQGFVENFLVNEEDRKIRVFLRYSTARDSVIQGIRRMSKPGLRRYISYKKIPVICGGLGAVILSTPAGVIDGETAKKNRVGGELICTLW